MDTRKLVVLTAIVLVASAGVALAATQDGGTTATTADGTTVTAGPGASGAAAQGSTGAGVCDYQSLYDETIDSVVAVRTATGQGSGFVYRTNDSAGYVVTNAHVVESARNVSIQFTRGEARLGTVVGRDAFADLAVVRVGEMPGYVEALPVADGRARHGQAVAALGQPFGLEQTITHGIVSGTNRTLPTTLGFTIPNVVQTDAPISPVDFLPAVNGEDSSVGNPVS
jgi:S1-C subfamily serine protease